MNILTITACTCWSIVLLILVYGWGYYNGRKPDGVPKFKNTPPPPFRKGDGYQPTHDILTDPPTGGSGVPEKI